MATTAIKVKWERTIMKGTGGIDIRSGQESLWPGSPIHTLMTGSTRKVVLTNHLGEETVYEKLPD